MGTGVGTGLGSDLIASLVAALIASLGFGLGSARTTLAQGRDAMPHEIGLGTLSHRTDIPARAAAPTP